jgi:hypothetical protein
VHGFPILGFNQPRIIFGGGGENVFVLNIYRLSSPLFPKQYSGTSTGTSFTLHLKYRRGSA